MTLPMRKTWWHARALAGVLLGLLCLTSGLRADDAAEGPAAGSAPAMPRDELIYKNGDHVFGRLIEHAAGEWVFKSEHFGVLRVADTQARVVLAQPIALPVPPETVVLEPGPEMEDEGMHPRWASLNPVQLARALKRFFGSWHGKLSFSSEVNSASTKKRKAIMGEGRLQRKWERDDVQTTLRYDYSETNNVPTVDTWKSSTTWRHDLTRRWFTIYEPTLEWNRAYTASSGIAGDYVLVQQEIGVGMSLFKRKEGQLNLGVSENLFDVWMLAPTTGHTSHGVESTFLEAELNLPWAIKLNNRGIYYYSIADASDGWENRFQVDKKLTQTFSIGVRHELRRNNPDVRISDYTQLKLLLGLDF